MKVYYSSRYEVSLPGHIWPTTKYRLIADRLRAGNFAVGQGSALSGIDLPPSGSGRAVELIEPLLAPWDDLALVHAADYLAKLRDNTLTPEDIATLELPWQPQLADAFRLMTGGTCAAAAAALEDGRAAHLGGGLHHAFAGHGEGFCPVNDIAVAIRVLQRDPSTHAVRSPLDVARGDPEPVEGSGQAQRIRRAAVVDCDVHHGNGTAMIFERDPDVFTFSIHQQHNYPFFKPRGDLDIGLEDGAADDRYLTALAGALPRILDSRPELVVYVAGADPFERDRLGGLKLTKPGLVERDRMVVAAARSAGVPLVMVLAGGYAVDVQDTVDIHTATVEAMMKA